MGQKGVLLSLVETVNLVDEDDGARAETAGLSASAMTCLISLMPLSTARKLDELGLA